MQKLQRTIQQLPAEGVEVFGSSQGNQSAQENLVEIIPLLDQAEPEPLGQIWFSIQARQYGKRTQESYLHWRKPFIFLHKKPHTSEMGEPEVNEYLTYLESREHVISFAKNQALSALLFLNSRVLGSVYIHVLSRCGQCIVSYAS